MGEDKGVECVLSKKEKLKEIERKRYLMVWVDNFIFLNYGYFLLIVNVVYDEVLYYINDEMKDRG